MSKRKPSKMRVMITGATGFVGYHTALELLQAGHDVSLLVRSERKMTALFGAGRIKHFTCGDVTDMDSVRAALRGCDAVIHSAAMVSTAASDQDAVFRTNVLGTRNVIGAALEADIQRVIHVSSVTALYDRTAKVLDANSPPGTGNNTYGRSKVASEKYVRKLQSKGAPIYVTYPATVIGPDDPGLTDAHAGLQMFLKTAVTLLPSGNQYVDVRDIAIVHRRLLEERPAFGRYLLGGHFLSWWQLAKKLEMLTGRRLPKVPVLGLPARLAGRLFDKLAPVLPLEVPLTEEAMGYATQWVRMDNSSVEKMLDFSFRPVDDSLRDSIAWMARAGHLSARQAGKLGQG
tara:strand:+ start:44155 stop:45189 length:1035 start_codon:yes stop_codon:yes gene_type:complete